MKDLVSFAARRASFTARRIAGRFAPEIVAVALSAPLVLVPVSCVNGKLTPQGESALVAGFSIACPFEAAIPVVGAEFAAECPGEDAAFKAALDTQTKVPGPLPVAPSVKVDAGAADAGAPKPVVLVRYSSSGELVHCGWATPGPRAKALQRALLAASLVDAGAGR